MNLVSIKPYLVSAKTGEGINEAFNELANNLLRSEILKNNEFSFSLGYQSQYGNYSKSNHQHKVDPNFSNAIIGEELLPAEMKKSIR